MPKRIKLLSTYARLPSNDLGADEDLTRDEYFEEMDGYQERSSEEFLAELANVQYSQRKYEDLKEKHRKELAVAL